MTLSYYRCFSVPIRKTRRDNLRNLDVRRRLPRWQMNEPSESTTDNVQLLVGHCGSSACSKF